MITQEANRGMRYYVSPRNIEWLEGELAARRAAAKVGSGSEEPIHLRVGPPIVVVEDIKPVPPPKLEVPRPIFQIRDTFITSIPIGLTSLSAEAAYTRRLRLEKTTTIGTQVVAIAFQEDVKVTSEGVFMSVFQDKGRERIFRPFDPALAFDGSKSAKKMRRLLGITFIRENNTVSKTF